MSRFAGKDVWLFSPSCDPWQFVLISCNDSYIQAKDCSLVYPDEICKVYENEYGRTVVCASR